MPNFDVFNGDADGILSLVQLRLAEPREAVLVTGRKRDIKLLSRVEPSKGDKVTVLDISMKSNADDLRRILDQGAEVFYLDHHNAGDIPDHPGLNAVIDTSPEICTAMLVDEALGGDYRAWAVTAAFGDNFPELAKKKAEGLALPLKDLARLGLLINYNGYGADLNDLHFNPEVLFRELVKYETPMSFLEAKTETYAALEAGYEDDLSVMSSGDVILETESHYVLILPGKAASRRMSGIHGNALAQKFPKRAHAILTRQEGGYLVSIRAPLYQRCGADDLALQFETGGGRSAAAGINHLVEDDLERFISLFSAHFVH
jgi:hypothetical protein